MSRDSYLGLIFGNNVLPFVKLNKHFFLAFIGVFLTRLLAIKDI